MPGLGRLNIRWEIKGYLIYILHPLFHGGLYLQEVLSQSLSYLKKGKISSIYSTYVSYTILHMENIYDWRVTEK